MAAKAYRPLIIIGLILFLVGGIRYYTAYMNREVTLRSDVDLAPQNRKQEDEKSLTTKDESVIYFSHGTISLSFPLMTNKSKTIPSTTGTSGNIPATAEKPQNISPTSEHHRLLLRPTQSKNIITTPGTTKDISKTLREFKDVSSTLPVTANGSLESGCKVKVKHFIMTKIEKTGSSTIFATLARFVRIHRLNILVQKEYWHVDWRKTKGIGWDIGPERVNKSDVLINHARYNETMYHRYVQSDYQLIVPVREPVSWFKSAARFFQALADGTTLDQIVFNDKKMFQPRVSKNEIMSWYHIPQLQWLGFDYSQKDNITAMNEFISCIVPKIDLPFLCDKFDASLIILKRRFCWDYTDIFYKVLEVTNSNSLPMSPSATTRLLSAQVNLGDKLLYEAMNQSWWRQPELREDNFWEEVSYFTALNYKITSLICKTVKQMGTQLVPAGQWHQTLSITRELCNYLSKSKHTMVKETAQYALGGDFKL